MSSETTTETSKHRVLDLIHQLDVEAQRNKGYYTKPKVDEIVAIIEGLFTDAAAWRALQGVDVSEFENMLVTLCDNAADAWTRRDTTRGPQLKRKHDNNFEVILNAFRAVTAERDARQLAEAEERIASLYRIMHEGTKQHLEAEQKLNALRQAVESAIQYCKDGPLCDDKSLAACIASELETALAPDSAAVKGGE